MEQHPFNTWLRSLLNSRDRKPIPPRQADIAARLGITAQAVHGWTRNAKPDSKHLDALFEALSLTDEERIVALRLLAVKS